jgi:hypothetical protein
MADKLVGPWVKIICDTSVGGADAKPWNLLFYLKPNCKNR